MLAPDYTVQWNCGGQDREAVGGVSDGQWGNLISMPYRGAIASSLSISSLVGGKADVAPSASGTPTSKNIYSRPAGATDMSIFAGLLFSFLKLCGVPTGILANVPAFATTRSPLIVNVISPSRM